jgi:hypothetical protein
MVTFDGNDLCIRFTDPHGVAQNLRISKANVTRIDFAQGPRMITALRQPREIAFLSLLCDGLQDLTVARLVLLMGHPSLLCLVQRLELSVSWKNRVDRDGLVKMGTFKPITKTQLQFAGHGLQELAMEEANDLPSRTVVRIRGTLCSRLEMLCLLDDELLNDAVINTTLKILEEKYQDKGCIKLDTYFSQWFWPSKTVGIYNFDAFEASYNFPGK